VRKWLAFYELARLHICVLPFVGVMVGYWLSRGRFDFACWNCFQVAGAVALAMAYANITNDILDVKIDAVNYPERPIPSGLVSMAEAVGFAALVFCISLVLGFFVSKTIFWWVLFLLLFSTAYNFWLKNVLFVGNFVVSFLSALPILLGNFVVQGGRLVVIPFGVILLFVLSREIFRTIQDGPGDQVAGRKTVFLEWGRAKAIYISLGLAMCASILLLIPLFTSEIRHVFLYVLNVSVIFGFLIGIVAMLRRARCPRTSVSALQFTLLMRSMFVLSCISFLWLVG